MKLRKGVKLIAEEPGSGNRVERRKQYVLAIRLSLNQGDVVTAPERCLSRSVDDRTRLRSDGYFEHRVRIDRENLIAGLFYAVQGMNVGGYRKVIIGPHLGYGERGVPGVIPENAKLVAEIRVLSEAFTEDAGRRT